MVEHALPVGKLDRIPDLYLAAFGGDHRIRSGSAVFPDEFRRSGHKAVKFLHARPCGGTVLLGHVVPAISGGKIHDSAPGKHALGNKIGAVPAPPGEVGKQRIAGKRPAAGIGNGTLPVIRKIDQHNATSCGFSDSICTNVVIREVNGENFSPEKFSPPPPHPTKNTL